MSYDDLTKMSLRARGKRALELNQLALATSRRICDALVQSLNDVAQYRAVLEEALRDHKRKKGNTPIDGQDRRPFSAVTADAQDNNTVVQTSPSLLGQAVSGHCQVVAGTTFRCMAGTGQGVEASSQFGAECALRTGSSAGQPRLASAAGISSSGALSSWPTLPAEPPSAVAQQHNPRGPVPAALGSAQGSGCLQQQQQQSDPLCPFGRRSVTCSSWGAGAAPVQEPTRIMGAPQRAPSPSPLPFERTSTCSYNGVPSSAPAPGPASSCLPFERGSACGYTPASSTPAAQATAAAPPSASPFARGSSCGYNNPNTSSALATWQQQLNGDGRAPAAPAASPFERTSSSFGTSPAPPTCAAAPSASPFERGSACGYTANAAAGAAHAAVPALPSLSPAPITSQPLGRAPSMGPTAPLFTALDQQQHHHQHGAVAVLPGLDRTSTLSSSFMGATCGPASVGGCSTETDAEGKSYSSVPAAPPSPQLQLPSAASDGPERGVTVSGRAVVLTPAAAADPLAATAAACLNTAAQQLKMLQQQQQQMLVQQQQLAAQQQILQQQIFRQRQEQQREQQEQEGRKGGSALQPELFPPIPASLLYQRLSAGRTEASAGSVASVTLLAPASAGGVSGAVHLSAGRQPAGPAPSVGSRPSPFAAPKPPAQQGTGPTAMVAAGAFRGAVSINPNAAAAAVAAGGIAVQHGQRVAGGGMSLVRGPQPHLQQQQQMRLQQQQQMRLQQQQQMRLQQMQVQLAASGAIGAVQSAVAACQQQEQEQEADRHLYEELLRALE